MLYDFLIDHRDAILGLTRQKTAEISKARPSSEVLERGLPIFYEHLIATLRQEDGPRRGDQSQTGAAVADKKTDRQIEAKVRQDFQVPARPAPFSRCDRSRAAAARSAFGPGRRPRR